MGFNFIQKKSVFFSFMGFDCRCTRVPPAEPSIFETLALDLLNKGPTHCQLDPCQHPPRHLQMGFWNDDRHAVHPRFISVLAGPHPPPMSPPCGALVHAKSSSQQQTKRKDIHPAPSSASHISIVWLVILYPPCLHLNTHLPQCNSRVHALVRVGEMLSRRHVAHWLWRYMGTNKEHQATNLRKGWFQSQTCTHVYNNLCRHLLWVSA